MKTRVISAVVGIILLIIVLNFFQTPVLNLAIMVIALIAMHEFLKQYIATRRKTEAEK